MDYASLWPVAASLVAGYLLGSLPFALWISRSRGVDILRAGSRNPGMTNVWRALGWKAALPVAALDALKGFLAAGIGTALTGSVLWALCAGAAAVLGHSFSFWIGFRGGKGVLTGFGVFLCLSPRASIVALLLWAAALAVFRYVSLASILAAVTLPVLIGIEAGGSGTLSPVFWVALPVCLFVIARHVPNIARLLDGTEPKFRGRAP